MSGIWTLFGEGKAAMSIIVVVVVVVDIVIVIVIPKLVLQALYRFQEFFQRFKSN